MTLNEGTADRVARVVAAVTAASAASVLYARWIRRRHALPGSHAGSEPARAHASTPAARR
jgi:hypothetical protein